MIAPRRSAPVRFAPVKSHSMKRELRRSAPARLQFWKFAALKSRLISFEAFHRLVGEVRRLALAPVGRDPGGVARDHGAQRGGHRDLRLAVVGIEAAHMLHDRALDLHAGRVGGIEHRGGQVAVRQVGVDQVGARHVDAGHVGAGQIDAAQRSTGQDRALEAAAAGLGAFHLRVRSCRRRRARLDIAICFSWPGSFVVRTSVPPWNFEVVKSTSLRIDLRKLAPRRSQPRMIALHRRRAVEAGAEQVAAAEVAAAEVAMLELGAGQVGALQADLGQAEPRQVGALHLQAHAAAALIQPQLVRLDRL